MVNVIYNQPIIRQDLEKVIDQIQDIHRQHTGEQLTWDKASKIAREIIEDIEK